MRHVMVAVMGTVLLVPALSSAQVKSPSAKPMPSGKGYIVLDANCDVSVTTDVEFDPSRTKVVDWIVFNDDCKTPKVAVGIFQFKTDTNYYPLFDCPGVAVDANTNKTKLTCTFNPACSPHKDDTYTYGVCVNGAMKIDPELRIKGTRPGTGGTCKGVTAKMAAQQKCEMESK